MDEIRVDGAHLEFEVKGSGPPLLLISTGPIVDSFLPFFDESELTNRYQLIRYRQRRIDPRQPRSVSFQLHAADAAGLLRHLGLPGAHVAGHSTGACIGLQLVLDHPEVVQSLILLEPPLTTAPSAAAFFEKVGPAMATYNGGQHAEAMRQFLSVVCSIEWEECRSVIDACVPGGSDSAVEHSDNFFESYLPALGDWQFGPEDARKIAQPVLTMLGSKTEPLFSDSYELLRTWLPQMEVCHIEGAAHLLHMEQPEQVVQGIKVFLDRHAMVEQR